MKVKGVKKTLDNNNQTRLRNEKKWPEPNKK